MDCENRDIHTHFPSISNETACWSHHLDFIAFQKNFSGIKFSLPSSEYKCPAKHPLSSRTGDLHGAKRFPAPAPLPFCTTKRLIFMARCKWPGKRNGATRRYFKCLSVFNACVSGSVKSVFKRPGFVLVVACRSRASHVREFGTGGCACSPILLLF